MKALNFEIRLAPLSLKLDVLIAALERRYRPDQPRAPKGAPEGGQWIVDPRSPGSLQVLRTRVAQIGEPGAVPNLLDHEGVNGAHSITEHVGKSDYYLLARVGGGSFQVGSKAIYRYRAGSFSSLAAANRLVNSTLALNRSTVLKVAQGIESDAYIVAQFGSPTGREALRSSLTSQPHIQMTYWVGVYIVHDPRFEVGYRIQTAYPRSGD